MKSWQFVYPVSISLTLDEKQVREQLLLDLRDLASASEAVTEISRSYRLSEPAESRLRAQVAG